jgi:Helicase conserved C-terminal domain
MAVALGIVRARIAQAVRSTMVVPPELGTITLRPHQVEAAALVLDRCRRLGGAVLADPVGAGKTYTALACAPFYDATTIVAPAVLRHTWQRALERTGRAAIFHSMEALSHAAPRPAPPRSLVIVDEAHHARNPATRRYQALARLTWGADVVLLTATPIHNTARDLETLVRLFARPTSHTLAAVTLRRTMPALPSTPRVGAVQWMDNPAPRSLLASILALPPPLPADDAGQAHALGILGMLRQWLTSQAALERSVQGRRLAATAMQTLLESGVAPTVAAIRRCITGDGALQLSLALDPGPLPRPDLWHQSLARWIMALDDLLLEIRSGPDADGARAAVVRDAVSAHADAPAVAFTHSSATAEAFFRRLQPVRRAAGVWGSHAHIASGRVPRAEVLATMGPAHPPATADNPMRVDLLVSTDVLSEGVDLQAAGTLVHLDLPWTPARLEQRIGRLRRPGSPHGQVAQYAFRLPGIAERSLRIVGRLCDKARISRSVAGIALDMLHDIDATAEPRSPVERILTTVRQWCAETVGPDQVATACVRVRGPAGRLVAVVRHDGSTFLLGRDAGGFTLDLVRIAALVELAAETEPLGDAGRHAARAERRVRRWCQDHEVLDDAASVGTAPQQEVLRRIHEVGARASRTDRTAALRLVAVATSLVRRATGAGAALVLRTWLDQDPRTLQAVEALVTDIAPRVRPPVEDRRFVPWAVLALVPTA